MLTRRLLTSLLAVVVCGLVVAGSPVGAANSAAEGLFDHDDNALTPEVRRFAGPDRYLTSLALAEALLENTGASGSAGALIVASGESVVDAAAAAGLAAVKGAPVVYTRSGRTSRQLRDFIVDQSVSELIIVGGVDAVSDSLENELAVLATVRSVQRLSGPDRYETSVAVAREMGEIEDYCGTPLRTAVLVNADSSLADVISVGPLAFATSLPVLLTSATELSTGVAGYLADAGIEQLLVVGGTAAVSDAVVRATGVGSVLRISGENQFETAVAVVREIDACAGVELSSLSVALVNADFAADGVAAGPALGAGLGGDSAVTPVLLVPSSDVLPSATQEYLRSTPIRESSGGTYVDLVVTAIGGTKAVSAELVQAAIAAAVTSAPLYVTAIEQQASDVAGNRWRITFSGAVNLERSTGANYATSALNPANYLLNGEPLLPADWLGYFTASVGVIALIPGAPFTPENGDEITVLGGKISGVADDSRRVKEHIYVHSTAYESDDVRPRIVIDVPADWHEFRLQITEENPSLTALSDFKLTSLTLNDAPLPATAEVETGSTADNIVICLFGIETGTEDATLADTCTTTVPTGGALLAEDDIIVLAAAAFVDRNSNSSRATTVRVADASGAPKLVGASVTEIEQYGQRDLFSARTVWWNTRYPNPDFVRDPEAVGGMRKNAYPYHRDNDACDRTPTLVTRLRIVLRTRVKVDTESTSRPPTAEREFTEFAGAFGNDWKIAWKQVNDLDTAQNTAPNVNIIVSRPRMLMTIEFDEDSKVLDIVKAIRANSEADQIFSVRSDAENDPSDTFVNVPLDGILTNTESNPFACENGRPGVGGLFRDKDTGEEELASVSPNRQTGLITIGSAVYTPPSHLRGQSFAEVTLTFNQPVKSFDFTGLIDANVPGGYLAIAGVNNNAALVFFRRNNNNQCPVGTNFPTGYLDPDGSHNPFNEERRWWEAPAVSDLTRTYTFRLNSDCLDLPVAGDKIKLPAGFATAYNDETSVAAEVRLRKQ